MMDKNEAVIEFLLTCPTIQENPLFFNFADIEAGSNHVATQTDTIKKRYIDGSVLKTYTFTIACYKAVSHNAIVGTSSFGDENMENMAIVQDILDWINEQADNRVYPNFGTDYIVEDMATLSVDPDLDGIDTSVNPPLARYSIGVKIEYLDNTKILWNN